jgi:NADH-quinone oxidoreductase subunit M
LSFITDHILTWVTFVPLLGSLLIWTVIRRDSHARIFALAVAVVDFVLSLHLWTHYDAARGDDQFVERVAWLFGGKVSYHLGMDGISLVLAVLTTFLGPIVVLSTWKAVTDRVRDYMAFLLFLQTAMLGTFFARDMLLFYVFWEAMLIPMAFIIGIWGGARRIYAAVKFFIFTMVGSVFMLVGILWMYFQAGGMGLAEFLALDVPPSAQLWLFAAFILAFAIKVPVFPLHTWLPDAHVEAPTAGSVILAGVLLKMGGYGFLRIAIPLFPDAALRFAPLVGVLAVIGIIYGALVSLVQPDLKKLVAYSSVSHLGFVMLGIAAFSTTSVVGSVYQMLNHGISTGALFFLVGMLYDRRHTRLIAEFGGLKSVIPWYTAVFLMISLSSIAVPGFNGFVGEFLILVGSWSWSPTMVVFASLGVILAAGYILWMVKRVFYGEVTNPENEGIPDLNVREALVLVPLVALALFMGVASPLFTKRIEPAASALVLQVKERAQAEDARLADASPATVAPDDEEVRP